MDNLERNKRLVGPRTCLTLQVGHEQNFEGSNKEDRNIDRNLTDHVAPKSHDNDTSYVDSIENAGIISTGLLKWMRIYLKLQKHGARPNEDMLNDYARSIIMKRPLTFSVQANAEKQETAAPKHPKIERKDLIISNCCRKDKDIEVTSTESIKQSYEKESNVALPLSSAQSIETSKQGRVPETPTANLSIEQTHAMESNVDVPLSSAQSIEPSKQGRVPETPTVNLSIEQTHAKESNVALPLFSAQSVETLSIQEIVMEDISVIKNHNAVPKSDISTDQNTSVSASLYPTFSQTETLSIQETLKEDILVNQNDDAAPKSYATFPQSMTPALDMSIDQNTGVPSSIQPRIIIRDRTTEYIIVQVQKAHSFDIHKTPPF